MPKPHSLFLLFLLLLAVGVPFDTHAKPHTLQSLIGAALTKNHDLRDAKHDLRIAEARLDQARSGYYPRIGVKGGSVLLDDKQFFHVAAGSLSIDLSSMGLPAIGNFDPEKPLKNTEALDIQLTERWINFGMIDFTQPVFTGGMVRGYNRMARGGVEVARAGRKLKRNDAIRAVIRRFNDVLLTEKLAALGRDTVIKLDTVLTITKGVYEAGSLKVSKLDYLKAKMIVASAKSFVVKLEEARRLARLGLKHAAGLPASKKLELVEGQDFPAHKVGGASSVERALSDRPEAAQLKAGIRALQAGVDVAWSRYLPDVAIAGGYMIDDKSLRFTDGHTFFIGLMLNYPLFEGFMTRAKVREARARLAKLKDKRSLLEQGITLQVSKARIELDRARKQLAQATATAKDAADYVKTAERGYQAELVELKELLTAQVANAVMQAQLVKARYDQSNVEAELHHTLGDMSVYLGKKVK
jgi:outer membrane protein TolC